MDGGLTMSRGERERAYVVRQAVEKRVGQREAAERLGVCVRQFKRLVRRWKAEGDAGLVSRLRGRRSPNRLDEAVRERIGELLSEKYVGFGPTLAAEKLEELDELKVSAETVRRVQIELGLWKAKKRRARRVFQPRERRGRFGELIQIDGSPHDWFEGRAGRCTLIVFIDDATSRLTGLRFVVSETTRAYLETLRAHVLEHGRPGALYSDRHGIFRVNAREAVGGDGLTEFTRVTERLGIETIQARTPQAKGRVERANQTLQDRLVKELRLRAISSMEAANRFAPVFVADWNARFAVAPREVASAHRPWTDTPEALDQALARREERRLSKALTFRCAATMYCVRIAGPGTALRGATVTLRHFLDGTMTVHYKNRLLQVTPYRTHAAIAPAEDAKTLPARLDAILAAALPPTGVDNARPLRRLIGERACERYPPPRTIPNGDIPTLDKQGTF